MHNTVKMRRLIVLALSVLFWGWALANPSENVDASDVDQLSVSPDSKYFVTLSEARHELLVDGGGHYKISIPHFTNDPQLRWSPDSRYLSIEYETSDDYSAVVVLDTSKLGQEEDPIEFVSEGFSARWVDEGHALIIVPLYGASDIQSVPGLIYVDTSNMTKRVMFNDYYFTGKYAISSHFIFAQVFRKDDGTIRYSMAKIELK